LTLLLDTNFVISFLKGEENSLRILSDSSSVAVSFITKIELLCYNVDKEEENKIKEFLDNVDVLFPDDDTIKYTIEIRKSTGLKLPDAVIAAQSRQYDFILATYDKELSKKVQDLGISKVVGM